MGQSGYIIDTNAVIDYLGRKLTASGMNFMNYVFDDIPKISVVTKIEVLGYNAPEEHYRLLYQFMKDAEILQLTNDVVDACIEMRKTHKIKIPDAIIAATAIVHNLDLITNNEKDFKIIEGLKIINAHKI